jgi:autotransporter adhesin
MSTVNISNSGAILTGTINASSGLTASSGANVNMGNNIIHGVAAGVALTDAVNVAQLIGATSGITTDISALETLTDTHTTQIANLETTTATHTTQITTLQTDLTAETAARTAADDALDVRADSLEAATATHTTQIAAIETVNATQSSQISALEAVTADIGADVDHLFDLRHRDRRDMKQGVAAAMSMANAPMPSAPGRLSYAVNGATFRGEYALGGSLMYRLPGDTPFAVNAGFSFGGHKNNGVRVGVAGEF